MGDRSPFRPAHLIPALLMLALFLGGAPAAQAGHDLGQDCYTCHNLKGGQVWPGSYAVWSSLQIGMSPYSRPISCDVCHPDYGNYFKATSESHHPVAVISGNTMSSDYDNGVQVRCRDCHNADSVVLSPNLSPDLSPASYALADARNQTDGYPNHDVASPDNLVNFGNPPHLLSMLLSGGQRTVSGDNAYVRLPSSNPALAYGFCLSCHDGSVNTARAVNVRQDYIDKGHYFKAAGTFGGNSWAAGDRIPCSDCHASHNSPTNARLLEPDNTTYSGTRPLNLRFASPYNPTNAEYRAVCNFCHTAYNATNTPDPLPTVRGVRPAARRYGIAGHAAADTQSCRQCHNPHNTPGGGPDCLTCHTTGGAAGTAYDYIDALFKGVGSDNTATKPADAPPLAWSQHGGFDGLNRPNFVYATPYDTKASNDCVKCHGVRHDNPGKLIDADRGAGDAYVFDNTATSLRTTTVANANAFCLTCHDGNGAAGDVRLGNQVPPNVATTWASRGHGLSGTYTVSGNVGANVRCVDCHEAHGSNHAKLLPADNTATGNFAMPAGKPGMTFRNGALLASALDFRNHSLPASGDTFGTTGNPGALTSAPQGYTGTATTGLCDACHRQAGRASGGTDNTTNRAHAHEGIAGQGSPPSQMTFTKDCTECHNVHGGANSNIYMVQDNIVVTQAAISGTFPVTFTTGTMHDPPGTGTALCNVCHASAAQDPALNVSHNYRTAASPDHGEGSNCTSCHAHGRTDNAAVFGFPQGGCNVCHGPLSDAAGMPAPGDGGTYDNDANNIIGTRGGDNTAHKIHVNYLVDRRGIARTSACYVCHRGGGAQEAVHPANPTNTSYKSLPTPTAVPYLQVAMDNTGTVLNVWNGAGAGPAYSGTPGQVANATNGWKTCGNTNCHYALSPSWSGKREAANYVSVTDGPNRTYPPLSVYGRGGDNVVVNQFRMATSWAGSTTVDNIVIAGTNVSGNVATVRVYRDAGVLGTFEPAADVALGAAVAFGADNTATASGFTETVNQAGNNYWIVMAAVAAPSDGAVVNASVRTARSAVGSTLVGSNPAVPGTALDNAAPTSAITTAQYVATADPIAIAGTAADGVSGVNHVDITIQRASDNTYWTGAAWGALTWIQVTGTTSWTYSFSPGDATLNVQSRATDNATLLQSPVTTAVIVTDRVRPTVLSAVAVDNTHVRVTYSEAVFVGPVSGADNAARYTVAPALAVSAAVADTANPAVILLTTATQGVGTNYTLTVDNTTGNRPRDLAGNQIATGNTATFRGYDPNTLNVVTGGLTPLAALYVNAASANNLMMQLNMATVSSAATVSQVVLTRAGTWTPSGAVAHIYYDNNSNGAYDATDTQIAGSPVAFSGTTATFTTSLAITTAGTDFVVAFDNVGAGADGQWVTAQATGVTATTTVNNASFPSRAVRVDKTIPTVAITTTSPHTAGADNTAPVTLQGTAADTGGVLPSGIDHVDVSVQDNVNLQYWNGSAWGGVQTWVPGTYNGIDNWTFAFTPGSDNALNVQARSTDRAGNLSTAATLNNLVLDRVHPTVVSAVAVSSRDVDVRFSEPVNVAQATNAANYVIAPALGAITVTQQSATVFRLRHATAQTGGTPYTVTVSNVNDLNGNLIGTPNVGGFNGYVTKGYPEGADTLRLFSDAAYTLEVYPQTSVLTSATNYYVEAITANSGATARTAQFYWESATNTWTALGTATTLTTTGTGPYTHRGAVTTPNPGAGIQRNYKLYVNVQGTGSPARLTTYLAYPVGTGTDNAHVRTFTDNTYTVQTEVYAPTDTVYVEVYGSQLTDGTPQAVNSRWNIFNYASTTALTGSNVAPATSTRSALRTYRMSFPLSAVTLTDGWWYYIQPVWASTSTTTYLSRYEGRRSINISSTRTLPAPPRQTGDNVVALACNTCHQFGPNDEDRTRPGGGAANGVADINEITTYPNYGQYAYSSVGSHIRHGVGDTGAPLNPTAANATESAPCHGGGVTSYGLNHMTGTVNLANGSIGYGTGAGTYSGGTNGTCSNVNCHRSVVTPAWGTQQTTCTSCHNNGANDGNINNSWPNTGKHSIHAAQSPTGYGYACTRCHPDNRNGHSAVNGSSLVTFARNFVPGGTYNADNTCSGTYCHSTARGANTANVAASWTGGAGATAACGTCHGSVAGTDNTKKAMPVTGTAYKHDNHINHVNLAMTCSACHYDASGTNGSYGNRARHANGAILTPVIDNNYRYELTTPAYAPGGTVNSGTCANVECHNGVATPAWNTATFTCGACHAIPPTTGPTAGSHFKHASTQPDCEDCHAGAAAYTVAGPAGLHQNLAVDLRAALAYADNNGRGGVNYAAGASPIDDGTCATASCHGAGAPQWGGTISGGCFACHGGTEQVYKPQNDYGTAGAPNPVDNSQYLYSGHGRIGTNYPGSNNPPAGLSNYGGTPSDCYYCHAQAAPHTTKSLYDPFRLGTPSDNTFGGMGDFTGVFADNTDRLCLGCHGSSSDRAGHSRAAALTINMQTHARGITGTKYAWPNSPWKCVDCHDPHGDGASGAERYVMVRSAINTPSGSTDPFAGSDAKSRPKRMVDANVRSIAFNSLAGFAAGSYAQSGNGTGGVWGPCEACHTQTNTYSRTLDNAATHATRTGRCTDCHGHDGGFAASGHQAGSSCKGCHASAISGTYARRAIRPEFDNTYRHGSVWATLVNADCEKCHEETSADNVVRLKVWNANAAAGTTSYTTVTYDNTNLASANAACISCHDADTTKITFTGNATLPQDVSWYTSTRTYNSHNDPPSATKNTVPVLVKARSPHENPGTNQVKGPEQAVFTDIRPVGCLHCHPSHGSGVASPANYLTAKTAQTGGDVLDNGAHMTGGNPSMLAGVGVGYTGEGTFGDERLCWGCHDAVGVNDMYGDSNAETVSAGNTPTHWQGSWTRPAGTPFVYKGGATRYFGGSHFYPSKTATWTNGVPSAGRTAVQCVSCHNPHGNATDSQYWSWALKGSWLTSPYKEDRVPQNFVKSVTTVTLYPGWTSGYTDRDARFDAGPRTQPRIAWNNPPNPGGGYDTSDGGSNGTGYDGYFIDDNTFGTNDQAYDTNVWSATTDSDVTRNTVTTTSTTKADDFAGLCAKCHADNPTQTSANLKARLNTEWSGHGAVAGFATTAGTANNDILLDNQTRHMHANEGLFARANEKQVTLTNDMTRPAGNGGFGWAIKPYTQYSAGTVTPHTTDYHQFTCSKCHSPHASRLPRLMRSNCLDVGRVQNALKTTYTAMGRYYPKHIADVAALTSTSFSFGDGDPTDQANGEGGAAGSEAWHYATTGRVSNTSGGGGRPVLCHNLGGTNTGTAGQAPLAVTGGGWNAVTGW